MIFIQNAYPMNSTLAKMILEEAEKDIAALKSGTLNLGGVGTNYGPTGIIGRLLDERVHLMKMILGYEKSDMNPLRTKDSLALNQYIQSPISNTVIPQHSYRKHKHIPDGLIESGNYFVRTSNGIVYNKIDKSSINSLSFGDLVYNEMFSEVLHVYTGPHSDIINQGLDNLLDNDEISIYRPATQQKRKICKVLFLMNDGSKLCIGYPDNMFLHQMTAIFANLYPELNDKVKSLECLSVDIPCDMLLGFMKYNLLLDLDNNKLVLSSKNYEVILASDDILSNAKDGGVIISKAIPDELKGKLERFVYDMEINPRSNIEIDDDGIRVCDGEHEKSQGCSYQDVIKFTDYPKTHFEALSVE